MNLAGRDHVSRILEVLALAGFDTTGAVVEPLSGGISCTTERVRLRTGDVVVKQALDQLLVEEEWRADPARAIAEGHGLAWLHESTPSAVPKPLAIIDEPPTIVIPMAPEPCPNWRTQLLGGPGPRDVVIAGQLRATVDTWRATPVDDALGTDLDDLTRVSDLRINAFYRDMAVRWPQYAGVMESCATELEQQFAMTHGDFTPKNVLCLSDGIWVIDAEITHIGNPILDVASMTTHLMLKSVVHRADAATRSVMADVREAFGILQFADMPSLSHHVGVILGVRIAGVSQVRYLDDPSRELVREMAHALLGDATLAEVECRFGLTP